LRGFVFEAIDRAAGTTALKALQVANMIKAIKISLRAIRIIVDDFLVKRKKRSADEK
jgi:hypothetical protein